MNEKNTPCARAIRNILCWLVGGMGIAARTVGAAETPVVVLPDAPSAVERSAAKELAGELGKCLGRRPTIVAEKDATNGTRLFVGATRAAKTARGEKPWPVDGVFLKSVPNGVVLDGDPARAPLYAVDLYLEKW